MLALLLLWTIHWWPVSPGDLAVTEHTHVEVTGRVDYVATEEDGDYHMRVCDVKNCIVAEIIPALPMSFKPRVDDVVRVRGIARIDKKHHWAEVHPVIEIELEKK